MTLTIDSPLVSCDWLQQHLDDQDLRILDCAMVMQPNADGSVGFVSGKCQWQESHIPNSAYLCVSTELSDPDHALNMMMPSAETLAETFRLRGIGDGTHCCRS